MERDQYVRNKKTGKVGKVVSYGPEGGYYRVCWLDEYYWPRVPLITRENLETVEVLL